MTDKTIAMGGTAVKMASGDMAVQEAAAVLAAGGIAAFPTETVYGLGADAFNPTAVAGVYAAKGRPGDNPLIMHIASQDTFFELAENPPAYAHALMKAFWPGPLTLVVKKKPGLPSWVGGHPKGTADTAGIRMPSHPLALALIKASGCVVAAPSANLAGTPSPTLAEHVAADFVKGEIDFILDGGAVPGGLESTVVDVTGPEPVILRPGAITAQMVAEATGLKTHSPELQVHTTPDKHANTINPAQNPQSNADSAGQDSHANTPVRNTVPAPHTNPPIVKSAPPRSPGMKYRHYAPKASMTLLVGSEGDIATYVKTCCDKEPSRRIGILVTEETKAMLHSSVTISPRHIITLGQKSVPETIAHNLYASLRQFDAIGVDVIYAEGLINDGLGVAIMDRMKKAAEGRVVML